MARPIWTGTLSFGLLNVPVSLMTGERSVDLHFRMLDSRNNTPVRYERVNAETGEEVPWKEIVKAFEYDKGSYVVLEPEDIKSAASEGREVVDVKAFVDAESIGPEYFEKPYFLVPGKKAEKGYVLLRETLKRTGKIGIARVVIRTREYLSAVMPRGDALMLMLLRYPQELVDAGDYKIPEGKASEYRVIGQGDPDGRTADRLDERRMEARRLSRRISRPPAQGHREADEIQGRGHAAVRRRSRDTGERHHQRGRFHVVVAAEPGQQQAYAGKEGRRQDGAQTGHQEGGRATEEGTSQEDHEARGDPQGELSTARAGPPIEPAGRIDQWSSSMRCNASCTMQSEWPQRHPPSAAACSPCWRQWSLQYCCGSLTLQPHPACAQGSVGRAFMLAVLSMIATTSSTGCCIVETRAVDAA